MKLHRNESCPIHRSLVCCGCEPVQRVHILRLGVQRIEDPHHPRGYRELRSAAEMRKLLNRKIVEQNRICAMVAERSPEPYQFEQVLSGCGPQDAMWFKIVWRLCNFRTVGSSPSRSAGHISP